MKPIGPPTLAPEPDNVNGPPVLAEDQQPQSPARQGFFDAINSFLDQRQPADEATMGGFLGNAAKGVATSARDFIPGMAEMLLKGMSNSPADQVELGRGFLQAGSNLIDVFDPRFSETTNPARHERPVESLLPLLMLKGALETPKIPGKISEFKAGRAAKARAPMEEAYKLADAEQLKFDQIKAHLEQLSENAKNRLELTGALDNIDQQASFDPVTGRTVSPDNWGLGKLQEESLGQAQEMSSRQAFEQQLNDMAQGYRPPQPSPTGKVGFQQTPKPIEKPPTKPVEPPKPEKPIETPSKPEKASQKSAGGSTAKSKGYKIEIDLEEGAWKMMKDGEKVPWEDISKTPGAPTPKEMREGVELMMREKEGKTLSKTEKQTLKDFKGNISELQKDLNAGTE